MLERIAQGVTSKCTQSVTFRTTEGSGDIRQATKFADIDSLRHTDRGGLFAKCGTNPSTATAPKRLAPTITPVEVTGHRHIFVRIEMLYGGPIDEKFEHGKLSVFLHFTAIFTVFRYLANEFCPLILRGI